MFKIFEVYTKLHSGRGWPILDSLEHGLWRQNFVLYRSSEITTLLTHAYKTHSSQTCFDQIEAIIIMY